MLKLSMSLLYDDLSAGAAKAGPSGAGVRSLDVVCKSGAEFRLWSLGLAYLTQGPPPPAALATHRAAVLASDQRRLLWTALRRQVDEATGGFPGLNPGTVQAGPPCTSDPSRAAASAGATSRDAAVLLSKPMCKVPASLATASLTPALAGASLPMASVAAMTAAKSTSSRGRGNEIRLALRKARRFANDAFVWGEGAWGQLGHGDDRERSQPELLAALLGRAVRQVAAGAEHSVILTGESRSCVVVVVEYLARLQLLLPQCMILL